MDRGADVAFTHNGLVRSSHWPTAERAHVKRQPACIVCGAAPHVGTGTKLNVHHKYPFHFVVLLGRPDLEIDERNLYTMCVEHDEEHHLLIGHLGSFESYNPRLEYFMALCRGLTSAQIRSMGEWIDAARVRPKSIGAMSDQEKRGLRVELDRFMPVRKP